MHYHITCSRVSPVLVSPLHAHLAQGTQKTQGTETLTAAFHCINVIHVVVHCFLPYILYVPF